MTSPHRQPFLNRGARRAQWLAVVCAVVVGLFAPRARAAAPLCDPSGASMVAPIPVLPNATGEMVAPKGCDDTTRGVVGQGRTTERETPATRSFDAPDRIVARPLVWAKPIATKMPRPDRASTPDLPAHTLAVYRPPRG